MNEIDPRIAELETRLDNLVRTQIDFQKEISHIRSELRRLGAESKTEAVGDKPPVREPSPRPPKREPIPYTPSYYDKPRSTPPPRSSVFGGEQSSEPQDAFSRFVSQYTENARDNLEKFIGENLISKIGIIVLVLGVGIGAKYAIDNNLISPLTRIIIGYVFGLGLTGLAVKLKPKYLNFSAVLMSGGMAIMYFVTYFAYSIYGLIPQPSAFGLMIMFTIFTVLAALLYNRQVIAHIGLVGAYAVPFLLSSDSGNYLVLFVYMAIINAGILAISIRKYWLPIFYTSFAFTWLIFYGWFVMKFAAAQHFYLALTFVTIFFAIFFATKIAQKVFLPESDAKENLVAAVVNGFVFYVFCFALSDSISGLEQDWTFFSFLAIATIAILAVSFRYYKQAFVYLTFPFVWAIYATWYASNYSADHFTIAATFALIFFAIFYISVLVHRLVADNFTLVEHTTAVLANSFVFYGFGYSMMDRSESLQNYLGLFTAANAGLHLVVAHLVSRIRESAVDVVQVLTILVLTFASIAIPVQFDGNFVTMIWSVEAALLFWFGRKQTVRLFEYFSYPVMLLAAGSMFLDWIAVYSDRTVYASEFNRTPFANGDLVTAAVFITAFAFIFFVNRDESLEPAIDKELVNPLGWGLATVAVFALYNALRMEIGNYHHLQIVNLQGQPGSNDLHMLNIVWQLNYTMLFLTAMAAVNIVKIRSKVLAAANTILALFALFSFASFAMVLFNELRESYMIDVSAAASINIVVRYISYIIACGLLLALYRYSQDELLDEWVGRDARRITFEAIVYSLIFITASCELFNLMRQFGIPDATKLGLSILWGVYALVLIVIGISRNRKHLRFAAFALLGVTLAKLFLYDIADLDTIPKTILFVTLGITLLIISFLYNKYKDVIFRSVANQEE